MKTASYANELFSLSKTDAGCSIIDDGCPDSDEALPDGVREPGRADPASSTQDPASEWTAP